MIPTEYHEQRNVEIDLRNYHEEEFPRDELLN